MQLYQRAILTVNSICSVAFARSLNSRDQIAHSGFGSLPPGGFPKWLGENGHEAPWHNFNATSEDKIPFSNVTRYYDWVVSRGQLAPDGVLRDVILVNNQFPGPIVEANWGDMIEIRVKNNITSPDEGTSIHWHGSLQENTPWQDGVPGVSQCPIAPGHSYTYRFRAEVYGTSFWHAHYSAQYTAGIAGPIQVYGPSQLDYDIDLGPVMLTDWYHIPYFSVLQDVLGTDYSKLPPTSDSGLINGRGRFDCSVPSYSSDTMWLASDYWSNISWACVDGSPYSSFHFRSGKKHRLRVMNHGADGIQIFAIDGHTMTVISVDYVPLVPYTVDFITLGVGQRTDVVVEAIGEPESSYWMRSKMIGGTFCGGNDNAQAIRAAVYYEDANVALEPQSTSSNNDAACVNSALSLTKPLHTAPLGENPFQQDIIMALDQNASGSFVWTMNGFSSFTDMNKPLLFDERIVWSTQPSVYDLGKNNTVLLNITNTTPFQHPIHLHGFHFQVVASGPEKATSIYPAQDANPLQPAPATVWNGSVMGDKDNPMRRDTQIVPALGFVAIQFEATNPGIWPLHCHTAWHLSGGMSINFVVQSEEFIRLLPRDGRARTCRAWDEWSQQHVVDQIDSSG